MPREVVERPREKKGPSATLRKKENAMLVSKNEQPAKMTADRALGPFDLTGEMAMGLAWRAALPKRAPPVVIAGRGKGARR